MDQGFMASYNGWVWGGVLCLRLDVFSRMYWNWSIHYAASKSTNVYIHFATLNLFCVRSPCVFLLFFSCVKFVSYLVTRFYGL